MCKSAYDSLAVQNNPVFSTPAAHEQYLAEVARKSADYEEAQRALAAETADHYNGVVNQEETFQDIVAGFRLSTVYPQSLVEAIAAHTHAITLLLKSAGFTEEDWKNVSAYIANVGKHDLDEAIVECGSPLTAPRTMAREFVHKSFHPTGTEPVTDGSGMSERYHALATEPGVTLINLEGKVVEPLVEGVMGPDLGEEHEEIPVQVKGVTLKS